MGFPSISDVFSVGVPAAIGYGFGGATGGLGGAQLGASLLGSARDIAGQQAANEMNLEIAQRQMEFQDRTIKEQMDFQRQVMLEQERYNTVMSNSAYQRAVADMKLAGINPILAYRQGGAQTPGISAPSGSAGHGASLPMLNPYAGLSRDLSQAGQSAIAASKAPAEVDKLNAEVQKVMADETVAHAASYLKKMQADLASASIWTEQAKPEYIQAQTAKAGYDIEQIKANIKILEQGLKKISMEGFSREVQEEFIRQNPWIPKLEALGKALGVVEQGKGIVK